MATLCCGKHWTRNQTWSEVLLPTLSNSVTLNKSCNLLNPQFPCQRMDDGFHVYFMGLLGVSDVEKLLNNCGILLSSVIKTISWKCWMDSFDFLPWLLGHLISVYLKSGQIWIRLWVFVCLILMLFTSYSENMVASGLVAAWFISGKMMALW